jgi:hypothetical protein
MAGTNQESDGAGSEKPEKDPGLKTTTSYPPRPAPQADRCDFWPAVSQLRELLDSEGLTYDERMRTAVQHFLTLPPTVRRQLVLDLMRLSMELPDIYAAVCETANRCEERGPSSVAG